MADNNTLDSIALRFINDKETQDLFISLVNRVQSKVVLQSLRKAGKMYIPPIKAEFYKEKKNKSKTGYKEFNSAFKIENRRKQEGIIGVKIGMQHRDGYKYRFINFGTNDREYRTSKGKIHYTGALKKTDFFYKAVEANKEQVQRQVSDELIKSLNNAVKQHEAKNKNA